MAANMSVVVLVVMGVLCLQCVIHCLPLTVDRRSDMKYEVIGKDIKDYQQTADMIMNYSLHGPGQNQSYNRLATFVDKYGSRISGSEALEDAIDYMLNTLMEDGLDNVHSEKVNVTHWIRGNEWAKLLLPREYKMSISGLGHSVGTPGNDSLLADVVVMRSFDELDKRQDEVQDRIVVFNPTYRGYPDTAVYRVAAASKAAKYGAVAVLIRTIGPFSIYSPHTGVQEYSSDTRKIPAACITIEDANMLDRLEKRGERLRIQLYMEAKELTHAVSRNTVAEIKGSTKPEQVVIVSGHLDSWDVGQGAMDDGGGAFVSWQTLSIIRHLGLKPKRTVRLVMWTDEEDGGVGSLQYYQRHQNESDNIVIALESDEGVFTPYGMQFSGSAQAKSVMEQIGNLLSAINTTVVYDNGGGTDVAYWRKNKVPTGSIANHNEHYFWFHHSNGDTMDVMDPKAMDLCAAMWTAYAYVLADMDEILPRG